MLARIRKSMQERDQGFTLIELLVVMIIIGILAAIAIPTFLNQRAKARDTATKADVSTVGKEIATYFVDGTGILSISETTGGVTLSDDGDFSTTINTSDGTELQAGVAGFTTTPTDETWCVGMTNPAGDQQAFKYSALNGLEPGSCP